MKTFKTRLMAVVLACIMILSIMPLSVFATETMTITVEQKTALPGSTVSVNINIKNNPGISSMKLKVAYDDALVLDAIEYNTEMGGQSLPPQTLTSPVTLTWVSPFANYTSDGTFATLKFIVSDDASINSTANISVTYDPNDIYNMNETNIDCLVENGCINIVTAIPGDINGDQVCNNKDITRMFQYLAGWSVVVNEPVLDTNGDGSVNNKDLTRLFQYIADWDVEIFIGTESTKKCNHELEAIQQNAASCTQDGNIAYWHCTLCNNYYNNAAASTEISLESTVLAATGHTIVIDAAKEPTKTEPGLTEGSHCSVCNEIIVAQDVLPPISGYAITYNIATGNSSAYIAAQGLDENIPADKREYFDDTGLYELPELTLDGYQFLGWYTAPPENSNALQVTEIPKGSTGNLTLYAHWYEYTYDITYKLYQTPLAPITGEKYLHYTTSKGLADLPNPELHNYVFMGWYTDNGEEMTNIPAGTTGDITLNAYWTSKRNLAKTVKNLEDPIVIENSDNGVIYFTYELGTIENVPLSDAIWTIQSVSGLAQQKSETVSTTISEEKAATIAETISNTTVDSASWTLSEDWNDNTSVNEEWAKEQGLTVEEANEIAKSASGTYSFTASDGGTNTKTNTDGTTTISYDSKNIIDGSSVELDLNVNAKYSNKGNLLSKIAGTYEIGGSFHAGTTGHEETNEHTGTDTTKINTTVEENTSTWNEEEYKSETQAASESSSVAKALSEIVSSTKGYGKSYSTGGENSSSQDFSKSESKSTNATSTLTYFNSETKTTTTTYSTDGKSEGCYRLVIAGTVHVFGVVGYDVATKSYFAYTYNVLDDKTYEFLDYSPSLAFNDYENAALPFEVPYFVHEYVQEQTNKTIGVNFKTDTANGTAIVMSYTGTDTDVIIPSYVSSGNTAYKVVGLSSNAFAGKNIESVILSDYITEIPDGAFKNCTNLKQVSGRFTKIGSEAFSGCTSLEKFNISSKVTAVGENAFYGVNTIYVTALDEEAALNAAKFQNPAFADGSDELLAIAQELTQSVVHSAVNSGAQNVILNISKTTEGTVLTINVPEIDSFELQGGLKTYTDLKIISDAAITTIKELSVRNCTRVPLEISSKELNLEAVSIESPGVILLLSSDNPTISLTRDSRLSAINHKAIVLSNPTVVSELIDNAVGTLDVSGNVYIYGAINGAEYIDITNGEIIYISEEEFDTYINNSFSLVYNANTPTNASDTVLNMPENEICTYDTPTILGSEPSLTGWIFGGWYQDAACTTKVGNAGDIVNNLATAPNKTASLYAKWTPVQYTVVYDSNGGTGVIGNTNHIYDEAVNLLENTFTKSGMSFACWNTEKDGSGTAFSKMQSVKNLTTTDGDVITLYAQWTNNIVVTLNGMGADNIYTSNVYMTPDKDVVYSDCDCTNTICNVSIPSKPGYTFEGYYTTDINNIKTYHIDKYGTIQDSLKLLQGESIELYADFTPIQYSVIYDANGGSGSIGSTSHIYDVLVNLPANTFIKSGMSFAGWNTKKDGSGISFANEQGVKNLTTTYDDIVTLYAQWTNNIVVTLNGMGADNVYTSNVYMTPDKDVVYSDRDCTNTISNVSIPSKPGYTFKGYYTMDSNNTKTYHIDKTGVILNSLKLLQGENIVLYADWTANSYTVSFNSNGGSAVSSTTMTYDSAYGSLPTPTLSDHEFLGWYLNGTKITNDTIVKTVGNHTLTAKWVKIKATVGYYSRQIEIGDHNDEFYPGLDRQALLDAGYTKIKLNITIHGDCKSGWKPNNSPLIKIYSHEDNLLLQIGLDRFANVDGWSTRTITHTISTKTDVNGDGSFWINYSGTGANNWYLGSVEVTMTAIKG